MSNVNNSLSNNAALFGVAIQKNASSEIKKTTQQDSKQARISKNAIGQNSSQTTTNPLNAESVMANYFNDQKKNAIEKDAGFQQFQALELSESTVVNGIINNSIFKKKESKANTPKQERHNKECFNVLGLFKPGELLGKVEEKEELRKKQHQSNPFTV